MRYSYIRESILHIVQESKIHPTTDMVHKEILKQIPNVSHVTIYRNLEKLVKMNKISVVNRKSPGRYCGNTKSHGHFYCIKCNSIVDKNLDSKIMKKIVGDDFQINNFLIEVYGVCSQCQ